MIRLVIIGCALLLGLAASLPLVLASGPELAVDGLALQEVRACQRALAQNRSPDEAASTGTELPLQLVSWNIYKANRDHLLRDLARLAEQADILFLQEAFIDDRLTGLKPYWRFAPGYVDGDRATGVLTLSPWPARVACQLTHMEPWLRTPKATAVMEYQTPAGRFLAVNLHAVNFEFSGEVFTRQLQAVRTLVASYPGPVIFAGDFNTWSDTRTALVEQYFTPLGLQPAGFQEDNRTRVFGNALDHIWTRGVKIATSEVPLFDSSDHNPLLVTVAFNATSANE